MWLITSLIAVVIVVALYIPMLRIEKSAWSDMARLFSFRFESRKSLSGWPGVLRGNYRGYDVTLESESRLFDIASYRISYASIETQNRVTDYLFLCRHNSRFTGTQRFWRNEQALKQQQTAINDAEFNHQFFIAGKPQQFIVDVLASNSIRQRIRRLPGKWLIVYESGKIYLVWDTIIMDSRKALDGFDLIVDLANAISAASSAH
jgi:hypothetical protein